MQALVVYESLFGNIQEVAQAITIGLSEHLDVELRAVTKTPLALTEPPDLIVVGGPTHAFPKTRPSTRAHVSRQGAGQGSSVIGLFFEWLEQLPRGRHSQLIASFDTRVATVRHLPPSAAMAEARIAQSLGYQMLVEAEGFYVQDVDGPLFESELARARAWGGRLGSNDSVRVVGRTKS